MIVKRWLGMGMKGNSLPSLLQSLAKDFGVEGFTNHKHIERNGFSLLYVEYNKETM